MDVSDGREKAPRRRGLDIMMKTMANMDRIDTLIPYKETTFKPKAHIGKLDLSASPWSISAKLGRFLLSGTDPESVGEIAREVAAYYLDTESSKLVDCEPAAGSVVASIVSQTPDCICLAVTDSDTVVVISTKLKSRYCGEHTWHWTGRRSAGSSRVLGLKLQTALGAMELLKPRSRRDLALVVIEETSRKYFWRGFDGIARRHVFDLAATARWDDEGNREANRRYADPKHTATVFEDKKNCDEKHRLAAADGFIASMFKHVEIDDEVDLDTYAGMQDEFEARWDAGELPAIDTHTYSLRFRKTGRHKAIGVYCDALKGIAVDPRAPRSLLHEFAHAYDFGNGQLSCSDGFRPVLEAFRSEFDSTGMSESKSAYYGTPTEVFARAWESYACLNGIGGSFVKTRDEMEADPAYIPFLDNAGTVAAYFDAICGKKDE